MLRTGAAKGIPPQEWGSCQGDSNLLKYPETPNEEWMTRRVRERLLLAELTRISLTRAVDHGAIRVAVHGQQSGHQQYMASSQLLLGGPAQVIRHCALREQRRVEREDVICREISTVAFESLDEGEVLAAYWRVASAGQHQLDAIAHRSNAPAVGLNPNPNLTATGGTGRGRAGEEGPKRRGSEHPDGWARRTTEAATRRGLTERRRTGLAYITGLPFDEGHTKGSGGRQGEATRGGGAEAAQRQRPQTGTSARERGREQGAVHAIARPLSAHVRPSDVAVARQSVARKHGGVPRREPMAVRLRRVVQGVIDVMERGEDSGRWAWTDSWGEGEEGRGREGERAGGGHGGGKGASGAASVPEDGARALYGDMLRQLEGSLGDLEESRGKEKALLRSGLTLRIMLHAQIVDQGPAGAASKLVAHVQEQQERFGSDLRWACEALHIDPEGISSSDGLWAIAQRAAELTPNDVARMRRTKGGAEATREGGLSGFMFGYLGMTRGDMMRAQRLRRMRAARAIAKAMRRFLTGQRAARARREAMQARKDSAAIEIQVRGTIKEAMQARQDGAAIKIQTAIRTWVTRRQGILSRVRRQLAAIAIQRRAKRFLWQRVEREQRRQIGADARVESEEFVAFLRYNTERATQWSRLDPTRHRAATLLQSFWKGHKVRMEIRHWIPAATCIQRHFRGWWARREGGILSEKVKERQLRRQRELGAIFEGHRRGVGAGLAVSKEVVRTWAEMTAEEVRLEEEERRQKGEMERRWTEFYDNAVKAAMQLPLPRGWTPQLDQKQGRILYVNIREAVMTDVHPRLAPAMDHLRTQKRLALERLAESSRRLAEAKTNLLQAYARRQLLLGEVLARKRLGALLGGDRTTDD